MIQATELRIGNYVEYMGQMLPVLAIDNEAFLSELKYKGLVRLPDKLPNGMVFGSSGIWCAKTNPIPITPEILGWCGFERKHGNVQARTIMFADTNSPTLMYYFGGIIEIARGGIAALNIPVQYLHQLQNLYYSLTNQELTFKTTTHD